jgi:phage host-nuclease inhibitor protein Gam
MTRGLLLEGVTSEPTDPVDPRVCPICDVRRSDAFAEVAAAMEAEALLSTIGKRQREVAAIEIAMNAQLAAVKEACEEKARPVNELIETAFTALQCWAEAHRSELLVGNAKTAKLATGEISWRMTPPSVRLSGVDAVLEALKQLGLGRFVRTKDEVDKSAILGDPDAVKGVKGIAISQREEFVAKPFESEIEKAATSAVSP